MRGRRALALGEHPSASAIFDGKLFLNDRYRYGDQIEQKN
jgi:hypothetical protein